MATARDLTIRLRCAASCVLALLAISSFAAAGQDPVQTARIKEGNAREGWQRVPDVLVALNVIPGAHVADVGSGDGFFTVRLARAVGPSGRVTAVDIKGDALERLRGRLVEEQLNNVDVVQSEVADPHLAPDSLDGILIVNAYHEMDQFAAMLDHLRRALKPGGRLVLVEPMDPRLRGKSRADQTKDHSLDAGFADRELRAAGFDVIALRDPFIRRGQSEQWLMVGERGGDAAMPTTAEAPARGKPAPDNPSEAGTDAELAAPDLRISLPQLDPLLKSGRVLVVDVRDADSYVAGHLPGAVSMPLGDLSERLAELRQENRQVVTYCS